jgi:hypothetical protein
MKICLKCNIEKDLSDFTNNKTKKDGKCVYCRSCYSAINKKWRDNNKDADKKIHDKWKSNNLDRVRKSRLKSYYNNHEVSKKRARKYKKQNQEQLKIKNRIYANTKYHNDLNYRLVRLLRGRIWKALKRNSKYSTSLELLGCSIEELKIYLEKQFVKDMNWQNYGQWHIDHIKPCSSFDLTDPEQQKLCFHYSNLQPLWAKDNIKKSDKII